MKKQIPVALLAIICIVLAVGLAGSKKENTRLKQQISELMSASEAAAAAELTPVAEEPAVAIKTTALADNQPSEGAASAEEEESATTNNPMKQKSPRS